MFDVIALHRVYWNAYQGVRVFTPNEIFMVETLGL